MLQLRDEVAHKIVCVQWPKEWRPLLKHRYKLLHIKARPSMHSLRTSSAVRILQTRPTIIMFCTSVTFDNQCRNLIKWQVQCKWRTRRWWKMCNNKRLLQFPVILSLTRTPPQPWPVLNATKWKTYTDSQMTTKQVDLKTARLVGI